MNKKSTISTCWFSRGDIVLVQEPGRLDRYAVVKWMENDDAVVVGCLCNNHIPLMETVVVHPAASLDGQYQRQALLAFVSGMTVSRDERNFEPDYFGSPGGMRFRPSSPDVVTYGLVVPRGKIEDYKGPVAETWPGPASVMSTANRISGVDSSMVRILPPAVDPGPWKVNDRCIISRGRASQLFEVGLVLGWAPSSHPSRMGLLVRVDGANGPLVKVFYPAELRRFVSDPGPRQMVFDHPECVMEAGGAEVLSPTLFNEDFVL